MSSCIDSNVNYWSSSTMGLTSTSPGVSYTTYSTDFSPLEQQGLNVEGDLKIKGNIYLEGEMYQNNDKVSTKQNESHDIDIEVVDNGYMAKIGSNTYVFSDLESLDAWLEDNFKTPAEAKKSIRKANGLTEAQQDILDTFKKLDLSEPFIAPLVSPQTHPYQPYTQPYTQPNTSPYIGQPWTGTPMPQISYTTSSNDKIPTTGILDKILSYKDSFRKTKRV